MHIFKIILVQTQIAQLCLVNLLLNQQQHFYPRNFTSFEILCLHIESLRIPFFELWRQLAKLQQADHSLGSDVLTSLCAQPTRIC